MKQSFPDTKSPSVKSSDPYKKGTGEVSPAQCLECPGQTKGGRDLRVKEAQSRQGGEATGTRRTVPDRRKRQGECHLSLRGFPGSLAADWSACL